MIEVLLSDGRLLKVGMGRRPHIVGVCWKGKNGPKGRWVLGG